MAEVEMNIEQLEQSALAEVAAATDSKSLEAIETKYLGRNGEYTTLLRSIGSIPADERKAFGQSVNDAKQRLTELIESRHADLAGSETKAQYAAEAIDITLPGNRPRVGTPHVLNQTMDRIRAALIGLGFECFEGPELETMHYNFDVLNYPPDHPAMDDQDTFYIDDNRLLRTQCTAFQGHVFETMKPPFRQFTVGRTFRNESVDRTHNHTFHQVDAFMVDEGVSMAHLKGTLTEFARAMFGPGIKVRFRPDFFPFVEPGVDYGVTNPFRGDDGSGPEWLEIGGAGLVHPNILENFGIDTEKYSGFAFGLGVERIALLQYGIDDLRLFFENDLRFLEQFPA